MSLFIPAAATSSPIGQTWHLVEQTISTAQQQLSDWIQTVQQTLQRFYQFLVSILNPFANRPLPTPVTTREVKTREELEKEKIALIGELGAPPLPFDIFLFAGTIDLISRGIKAARLNQIEQILKSSGG